MLNQYFAEKYNGKLIIRFDDTNPSKEKAEFQDSILEDLALMGIHGDTVTYTSDYFQTLFDYCVTMIKTGKAYCDDTEQMKVCHVVKLAQSSKTDVYRCELNVWTVFQALVVIEVWRRVSKSSQRKCSTAQNLAEGTVYVQRFLWMLETRPYGTLSFTVAIQKSTIELATSGKSIRHMILPVR